MYPPIALSFNGFTSLFFRHNDVKTLLTLRRCNTDLFDFKIPFLIAFVNSKQALWFKSSKILYNFVQFAHAPTTPTI